MEVKEILEERGNRYGTFIDNAWIASNLKGCIRKHIEYFNTEMEYDQREALDQICSKISRIITGDSTYIDNWDDIAGYATLVADRLRKQQAK